MNPFETNATWTRPEHDALVGRLQDLEWAEVRPELRERCWDDFAKRLNSGPKSADSPARTGERYAFSRATNTWPGAHPVADARAEMARRSPFRRGA